MNALADALAVHSPPERDIAFRWPDAILLDDGLLGGGRLVTPKDCVETAVRSGWSLGECCARRRHDHVDPGFAPGSTTLVAEGFEVIDGDLIIESFARHLMSAFDRWSESGFRAIGEDYLSRLPKKVASERRILDANGDLVVGLPSAAKPERFSLAEGLKAAAWYDPITQHAAEPLSHETAQHHPPRSIGHVNLRTRGRIRRMGQSPAPSCFSTGIRPI